MTIYRDSEGNLYSASCQLGMDIATGSKRSARMGCSNMGCACGSDESPLTLATPKEAEGFWSTMNHMAGEAYLSAIRDW